jgi:hypothetical protein
MLFRGHTVSADVTFLFISQVDIKFTKRNLVIQTFKSLRTMFCFPKQIPTIKAIFPTTPAFPVSQKTLHFHQPPASLLLNQKMKSCMSESISLSIQLTVKGIDTYT